ncbi:MAG TPA: DNA adenine methylase [Gammaproteobacteria bacterium]|nr:DNA adenine methylase [Gammaproteobacteria bacterium]
MTKPIIPWIGGERRLAKHILPLFPDHRTYVEPFCGAAALFFMKEPVKTEVINDINGDVVNLYRVTKHHLEEFCKEFKRSLVSREMFEWANVTPVETLTDIQRAARFFYLQKLSFGGKVQGRTFWTAPSAPPKLNFTNIDHDLSQAHWRLARVYVEHLDWRKCVAKYDRDYTLFYCDPPYWETEGYGVDFGLEQYHALAELAKNIKGKMLISLNDHPVMRTVFDGMDISTVDIRYTVGGSKGAVKRRELIIRNW